MIRVIDADVLMESLKRWRDEWAPVNNGYIAINEVISNVEKMPTVDAIPVTRCRDCRYFYPGENTTRGWCELSQHGCPNADDYCSDAEREAE